MDVNEPPPFAMQFDSIKKACNKNIGMRVISCNAYILMSKIPKVELFFLFVAICDMLGYWLVSNLHFSAGISSVEVENCILLNQRLICKLRVCLQKNHHHKFTHIIKWEKSKRKFPNHQNLDRNTRKTIKFVVTWRAHRK